MDAAKAAISKLTSNKGHHTTVDETVHGGVINETVKPQRHEETTQAIDREVHQDHYHTTVQPLQDQQVLPEKHTHNQLPTENREFRHDDGRIKQQITADLGRFQDTQTVEQTRHSNATAPSVTGEHVHHHVHETVVPVVHKSTIQPEVVHTTVPIHETHHAAAQEHGLSQLPVKSLSEFQKAGGKLSGGNHSTHEEYDGPPRQYNSKLATTFDKLGMAGHSTGQQPSAVGTETGTHGAHGTHAGAGAGAGAGVAAAGVGAAAAHHRRGSASSSSSSDESIGGTRRKKNRLGRTAVGAGMANSSGTGTGLGSGPQQSSKLSGSHTGPGVGNGVGSNSQPLDTTSAPTSRVTGEQKPGLADRLDPRVDADRDGKAGLGD